MVHSSTSWRKGQIAGRGPAVADAYEVECGFCRQLVSLPASALGRGFPCPACSGMLALVSPVPIVPAVPAALEPPAFEVLERDRWHPPGSPAAERERQLDPSWRDTRRGLLVARAGVLLALPVFVLGAALDLFLLPFFRPNPLPLVWGVFQVLPVILLLLLPVAGNTVGQVVCARGGPSSYAARRSLRLQAGAVLVLVGFSFVGPSAVVVSAVLLLAGWVLWSEFLDRLARHIDEDDHATVAAVRACRHRCWGGLGVLLGLFVGAALAASAGNWSVLWLCRAAACGLGVVLVMDYATVLQTVARAIARRAPVVRPTSAAADRTA